MLRATWTGNEALRYLQDPPPATVMATLGLNRLPWFLLHPSHSTSKTSPGGFCLCVHATYTLLNEWSGYLCFRHLNLCSPIDLILIHRSLRSSTCHDNLIIVIHAVYVFHLIVSCTLTFCCHLAFYVPHVSFPMLIRFLVLTAPLYHISQTLMPPPLIPLFRRLLFCIIQYLSSIGREPQLVNIFMYDPPFDGVDSCRASL